MKWLIVGTGDISQEFTYALKKCNQEISVICSRTLKNAQKFAKHNSVKFVTTNLKDYAQYCDAIYIGTPNTTHYKIAIEAIKLNKNVMVEKPMTHSYKLTKELFSLAAKHNVRIMEAYTHITHKESHNIPSGHINANFIRKSQKIIDNTYKTSSTFSRKMFGGVIPDVGVYPIAMAILINGNVTNIQLTNVKMLNNVEVECQIELTHEKGTSKIDISKLKNGSCNLSVDNKVQLEHINHSNIKPGEHKMEDEIRLFVSNQNIDWIKDISIETARVVEYLKSQIN